MTDARFKFSGVIGKSQRCSVDVENIEPPGMKLNEPLKAK